MSLNSELVRPASRLVQIFDVGSLDESTHVVPVGLELSAVLVGNIEVSARNQAGIARNPAVGSCPL